MKPFYRLADFKIINPLTQGKTWTAECPVCGKNHLKVNRNSGLYHCFTPGCNFNGILDEYKDLRYQHNALGECPKSPTSSPPPPKGGVACRVDGNWDKFRKPVSEPSTLSDKPVSGLSTRTTTPPSGAGGLEVGLGIFPSDYPQLSSSLIRELKPIDAVPEVVRYLEEQKIPVEVALGCGCYAALHTCWDKEGQAHHGPCLAYVNYVFGNIVNIKYRLISPKAFSQDVLEDKTLPAPPYAIDCINMVKDCTPSKVLYLTEGEKDVLTLRTCGYNYVISPPNGSGSDPAKCLDPFVQWLELVEHVVICGDSDRAGRKMKHSFKEYFEALGKSVCIAELPYGTKDISEVMQQYGMETVKSIIDPISIISNPECVRIADDLRGIKDVLMGRFDHGYSIGYGPHTDQHFMLTGEGGLIVVTGRPNHGKTDWMRCTLTRLMMQKQKKICFLSFEEPNKRKQVRRIVEVAFDTTHTEDIPAKLQDGILNTLDQCMLNLHLTTTAPTPTNIINHCNSLMRQGFNMDFLYIDPYLFIQNENTKDAETLQIKQTLTTLQGWARERHIWVIVVAHPRKLVKDGTSGFEEVDEYTISGSAHWANLADYLLSVKRVFPGGLTDEGSMAPSFTVVNMLKVRDQNICQTGKMYYLRHASGRYEEETDEGECKRLLGMSAVEWRDEEMWG